MKNPIETRRISREGHEDCRYQDGTVVRWRRQWTEMGGQYCPSEEDQWSSEILPVERSAFAPGWSEGIDGVWRAGI